MLTPQQQVDARRYMGYPMTGDTSPDDRSDAAYAQATSGRFQTLAHRLTSLRAEEEAIVANYLTTLASLEWGITSFWRCCYFSGVEADSRCAMRRRQIDLRLSVRPERST